MAPAAAGSLVPEVEVVEAADGADGGGGGGAFLEEETEALAARVGELELCSAAAAWRRRCAASSARPSVLNERLTQHMIAIDSVELPAATAEAARRAQGAPRAGGRLWRASTARLQQGDG